VQVTVTGSNFTGASAVNFGGVAATDFTLLSDTALSATAPAGAAGTVDVTVTTPSGTSPTGSADHFTYAAVPVPAVSGVSPTSGPTGGGTVVTVTGSGFTGATDVLFGGVSALLYRLSHGIPDPLIVNSDTQITVYSPADTAGTIDVTVVGPGGTSATNSSDRYTYTAAPAPAVTAVSPNAGTTAGGTAVTITGTNFSGASAVSFGGVAATAFVVNSDTSISATSPSQAAGTVDVIVTTPTGTSPTGSADQFTYTAAPAPTVTGLGTTSGPTGGGTSVVISGTHFTGATVVDFGSVPASFTVNNDTTITAVSPSQAAGTVDVTVTTPGGTSPTSSADHFTYTAAPAPSVTGLSPTSGPTSGGNSVVILGNYFTGASAVYFGGVAATGFTVNSDTSVTAVAPPGAAGTVDVTVTTPSGTSPTGSGDHYTYTNVTAPAPVVTGVSPGSGSTAGGMAVTITGSYFSGATAVTFGGTAASFTVNSDSSITATAPAGSAGTVDVQVTTNNGTSATGSADHFNYMSTPAPTVTSLGPTSGPTSGGTLVAVNGTDFTNVMQVDFGGQSVSFAVNGPTLIYVYSPPAPAGTVNVAVMTPSGTSPAGSGSQFTYTAAPVPVVTGLSPTSGSTAGGNSVSITGSHFTGATGVSFGGAAASFTVNSDTSITATAPPQYAGTYDVTVSSYSGTSALGSADRYTYTLAAAPAVTSISPNTGSTAGGTGVTITGTGFTGASDVDFGGVPATFTVNSDTSISATAPSQAAGTVDVTVTTTAGTSPSTSADQFTYTAAAAPSVTGVSPNTGDSGGGTAVTVTGSGFTGATAVSFGGVAASFTVNSDTSLSATAPAQAAGTVDVTVTTPSGTSATGSADQFTYTAAPAPTVSGITPSSGPTTGGTLVTITGVGFTGASAVSFGGVPAAGFTVDSDTLIVATAPAEAAGTVHVTVTTPSGSSATSAADRFTYSAVAGPAVMGITPAGGSTAGGTPVTVSGSGFTGATGVNFGGTAASSFTVLSDTLLTATAPAATAGTVDVTVTTPGGTSATGAADQFTYTAPSGPAVTGLGTSGGTTAGGQPVVVTGSGFTGATAVLFGAYAASAFVVNSDGQLTAVAPPQAAGTVDVTVVTPGGTSAAVTADQYTDTAAPVPAVMGLAPGSGPTTGGTSVSISGTHFTGATAVTFGGVAAAFTVNSDNSIFATAPAGVAGTVLVQVVTASGTSGMGMGSYYTYVTPTPVVTAISPTSGPASGGTVIIISGSGFTGATSVGFGTVPAAGFTVNSDGSISATAPAELVGTVDVFVTTSAGRSAATAADRFTFT
jgi:hypothetical protein